MNANEDGTRTSGNDRTQTQVKSSDAPLRWAGPVKPWHSLRLKSSIVVLSLILVTVLLLAGLSLTGIKAYQGEQLEAYLASQARTGNVIIAQENLSKPLSDSKVKEIIRQMTVDRFMSAEIYDMNGKIMKSSIISNLGGANKPQSNSGQADEVHDTSLTYALQGNISYTKLTIAQTYGDPIVDYYAPLSIQNKQVGVLRLTYRYQSYEVFYEKMASRIAIAATLVFMFSAIIGLWYFGRQAKVIEQLEQAVAEVTGSSLGSDMNFGGALETLVNTPLLERRKDELGRLGIGIGDMSKTIHDQIGKLEQEHVNLSLAIEKLKIMETKQRQFFGNITHEFKTPLSVINAYNDLTSMYQDDPELLENSRRQIKNEVLRLSTMVEQSLELSKTERYDFEIKHQPVNLEKLLRQTTERLRVKAEKFDITLNLFLEGAQNLEPLVLSDEEALSQIFVNLLDNAIKYNVSGGKVDIRLSLVSEKSFEGKVGWEIQFNDSGRGMDHNSLENLFEPFSSMRTDNLTEIKGSGLGLALVKRLVNMLGATIAITSIENEGTQVMLQMPLS